MKNIILLSFLFVFFANLVVAQNNPQDQLQFELEQIDGMFEEMMKELNKALGESHIFMDQLEMDDLGNGRMQIEGDTVDVGQMFKYLTGHMNELPDGMRPSDQYLEGLEGTTEMLPGLLEKSTEMFQNGSFEELFGELFKEFDLNSPFSNPYYQHDSESIPLPKKKSEEPSPRPPRNEKHRKRIKHNKTTTI